MSLAMPAIIGASQQKRSGRPFIIKVNYASGFTVTLPLISGTGYNYNFIADWGDGAVSQITSATDANRIHTYSSGGTYTITMTGTINGFHGGSTGMKEYLIEVTQWGRPDFKYITFSDLYNNTATRLVSCYGKLDTTYLINTSMHTMFYQCTGLVTVETGDWDVSQMTTFWRMFGRCTSLANVNVDNWDISSCTNFGQWDVGMFGSCGQLTTMDLSGWVFNSSSLIDIAVLFVNCSNLTSVGDISGWNTGKFRIAGSMFSGCSKLYQTDGTMDVSGWDLRSCTQLDNVFSGCVLLTEIDVTGWQLNTTAAFGMASIFANCYALVYLTGNEDLDVTQCNSMSRMFMNDSNLLSLDTSGWSTGNNTSFYRTFYHCHVLANLDVSGWDVGKVTDWGSGNGGAFAYCYAFTELDCSGWVFSSINNIRFETVFYQCSNLETIGDVSGWNCGKMTSMSGAFSFCPKLTPIDCSSWNVSTCTNFSSMFNGCIALTEIDVSSWTVTAGVYFSSMFSNCTGLTYLDLYGWTFSSSAVEMTSFMAGCTNVTTIDYSAIGTGWVIKPSSLSTTFANCYALTNLDTSNWDLSACVSLYRTFMSCYNLGNIDVSSWDVSKVTNFGTGAWGTFYGCSSFTTLDCSGWILNSVSNVTMVNVFTNCTNLTSVGDISGWAPSKVTLFDGCFSTCPISSFGDISSWNVSSATSFYGMFQSNTALTSIDISDWTLNSVSNINMQQMFYNCTNLVTFTSFNSSNLTKVTNNAYMFQGCSSLTSITFPNTLTVLSNQVCNGCTVLATINVGTGVASIGNYVFSGVGTSGRIVTYNFYRSTAPTLGTSPFPNSNTANNVALHIPAASSSYTTAPWTTDAIFDQPIIKDL